MKRMCREGLSRPSLQMTSILLSHVRVVTDPKKLAWLYAEAEQQKRYTEARRKGRKQKPTF
jgi:hypothetical protein